MKEKNLAVELLKKLIAEQVSVYRRTNVVKSEKFSEIMQRSLNSYLNGIDIKDMNHDIYKHYTGCEIYTMLENLKVLIKKVSAKKITVRVPLIQQYNTEDDVTKSIRKLKDMGFVNIETFRYSVT